MDINKISQIIDNEIEIARKVNPMLVLGMEVLKKKFNSCDDVSNNRQEETIEVCPECLSSKYHWDYEDDSLLRCEHCNHLFNEDNMETVKLYKI